MVSVPIRGLFNLTFKMAKTVTTQTNIVVSVPIRGLFNLTPSAPYIRAYATLFNGFRPHQGII